MGALEKAALAVRVDGWEAEHWVAAEHAAPYVHMLPDDEHAYVTVAPWVEEDGALHSGLWHVLARRVTTAVMRQPGWCCVGVDVACTRSLHLHAHRAHHTVVKLTVTLDCRVLL